MAEKDIVPTKMLPDLNGRKILKPTKNLTKWLDSDQRHFFAEFCKIMPEEEALVTTHNLKVTTVLDEINFNHGIQLFDMSKKQARLTGKCWFALLIERDGWLQMSQQPLSLKLGLDPYGWGGEHEKEVLEKLDNFNPLTHYMISAEFAEAAMDNTPMMFTAIVDPMKEIVPGPRRWKFNVFIITVESIISIRKQECCVCRKRVTHMKLKKCSKCLEQRYCSKECQLHIWPHHKQFCGLLAKLHATRPTSK